jgi:hypothetical protein
MKKAVTYATIIFWLAFTVLAFNSKPSAGWWLGIIIVCSMIIQWGSTPNPKIKKGRCYKLEKIIPHADGSLSIILSYDDKVETFKCAEILASFNPQIGNEYLVEIETGTIIFTPT